jgi:hypothetical protein
MIREIVARAGELPAQVGSGFMSSQAPNFRISHYQRSHHRNLGDSFQLSQNDWWQPNLQQYALKERLHGNDWTLREQSIFGFLDR